MTTTRIFSRAARWARPVRLLNSRSGSECGSAALGVAIVAFTARAHGGAHPLGGHPTLAGGIFFGVMIACYIGWRWLRRRN